jgi:1-deoxy-D-xylulose-5-phosphate reductoisomerase
MSAKRKASLPVNIMHRKSVTILGATGTIGTNTLKIIESQPEQFYIDTITGSSNVALLAQQARHHHVRRAIIANDDHYDTLKTLLTDTDIEVAAGEAAIIEAASQPADIIVSAIVGSAALLPTLAAIGSGAQIALANKECLVCAGELINAEVRKHGATLIPVDSEHSGIFQLMNNQAIDHIDTITITASGGPFRTWSTYDMRAITPQQAIKHPNWSMGAKISVDSATLMNKGLELIEAYHLFPLKEHQFNVLIHPESVVHCLVHMIDGSVLAQLSMPDMCTPIAVALAWPNRIKAPVQKLDLAAMGSLHFETPDTVRFPALRLAREALITGGNAPTVLNAANEVAVNRFLNNDISFLQIAAIVERTLSFIEHKPLNSIEDVLAYDAAARRFAKEC